MTGSIAQGKGPPAPTSAERRRPRVSSGRPRSLLRELVGVVSKPGVLSFAGGFPAPELFPRSALGDSFARVLETDPGALQYGPQLPALTEHIVTIMERRGVRCSAEQILVTSGAQQGIRILTELLLRERRPVLLEQVVYTGLTTVLASYDPEIRVVRSDSEDGLDPDDLLKQLENDAACAFLYVVPDAQNLSGTSLPISSRQRIVELAVRYEVPIIEDDPYGFLVYDGEPLLPLSALDARGSDSRWNPAPGLPPLDASAIHSRALASTFATSLRSAL